MHGSCQDDIAIVAHDMGVRVIQLEGFGSRVLILDSPLADSSPSLLEALREPPTPGKDVHGVQCNAIILCMTPAHASKGTLGLANELLLPSSIVAFLFHMREQNPCLRTSLSDCHDRAEHMVYSIAVMLRMGHGSILVLGMQDILCISASGCCSVKQGAAALASCGHVATHCM